MKARTMRLALICFTGILLLASPEPVPGAGPEESREGIAANGKFQQNTYLSRISSEDLRKTPTWAPPDPIPLSIEKAIEVARLELGQHVDDADWYLQGVVLRRLNGTQYWVFVVQFTKATAYGQIQILVDMAGRPGKITVTPESEKNGR